MNDTKIARSRWGRARFGGGSPTLLSTSLVTGILISTGLGGLFVLLSDVERPELAFALVVVCTLPVAATLGWVVLVDRSTLAGAIDKPDDSIESAWHEKAASGTFGDILIVGGLGAAGFAFAGIEAPITWVLSAIVLFVMLDFAARYLWLKKTAA
jgi:hypothetical protein